MTVMWRRMRSGAHEEKEEEMVDAVAQSSHALVKESPPSLIEQMEEMFLSLGLS